MNIFNNALAGGIFRLKMEEEKISAILDEEIEAVLKSIGQLDAVRNGEVLCCECGIQVSLESIQTIQPLTDGSFLYTCNSIECAKSFLDKQRCGQ